MQSRLEELPDGGKLPPPVSGAERYPHSSATEEPIIRAPPRQVILGRGVLARPFEESRRYPPVVTRSRVSFHRHPHLFYAVPFEALPEVPRDSSVSHFQI